jgi:hypothetical protein
MQILHLVPRFKKPAQNFCILSDSDKTSFIPVLSSALYFNKGASRNSLELRGAPFFTIRRGGLFRFSLDFGGIISWNRERRPENGNAE